MRPTIVVFVVALTLGVTAAGRGQSQQFPFEAVVDAPQIYVRSGPGEDFYPTTQLRRGDKVKVYRKDPGGWFMIAPPAGSFSWIAARHVRRTGENTGEVREDFVSVWVGSELGEENNVFQRRLSRGEEVTVLGQKVIRRDGGPERMLMIRPPRNEWRWIPGHAVLDPNSLASAPNDRSGRGDSRRSSRAGDSTNAPSSNSTGRLFGDAERPVSRPRANRDRRLRIDGPPTGEFQAQRDRLKQLDARFRLMIRSETREWDFKQLEQEYRDLQRDSHPALAAQAGLRLPAIERYRKIKAEYDEFVAITQETDRRDAELLGMSGRGRSSPPTPTSRQPIPEPEPGPRDFGRLGRSDSVPAPVAEPESDLPPTPAPTPPSPPAKSRFVGAGIVQRSVAVPGALPFALIAPPNRVLAYLQPESTDIELDNYVGQAFGIEGERSYDEQAGTDIIKVRKLVPIRLRGQ